MTIVAAAVFEDMASRCLPVVGPGPSLALVPVGSPDLRMSLLLEVCNRCRSLGQDSVSAMDMVTGSSDVSMVNFEQLVGQGYLQQESDEFGDSQVCVDWERVLWSFSVVCGSPVYALSSDRSIASYRELSNIECVFFLMARGWLPARRPEPISLDGLRHFQIGNLLRSHEYWQCLLSSAEVLDKGQPSISHTMPKGYYLCLMNLGTQALVTLHAAEAGRDLNDQDYMRFLRGQGIDLLALEDAPVADEMLPLMDADVPPPLPSPLPAPVLHPTYGSGCCGQSQARLVLRSA